MNINNVTFERSFGVSSQLTPSTMPEIAFAGRSNVGKSSLLNKLFNRKGLAKVSQTPGKTATINFFSCDGVRFVDLPGYGYAKVDVYKRQGRAFPELARLSHPTAFPRSRTRPPPALASGRSIQCSDAVEAGSPAFRTRNAPVAKPMHGRRGAALASPLGFFR